MQISKINIDRYRPKIQKNIQNANKKLLKHNRRKLLPTMVFALMPLSLLSNINNSNTKEQIVKNNPEKYNIEYFNVKNSTKLSIENSLNELIE